MTYLLGGLAMVFSSLEFLFRFLPIFLIIYYILPEKYKNLCLFLGSLVFYSFGEVHYVFLILLSIAINYLFTIQMSKENNSKSRTKLLMIFILLFDFGMLFFFKYIDFVIEIINSVMNVMSMDITIPAVGNTLPLGISFYTFQIVSYVIDVYQQKIPAEYSILNLGTYICMFPQLIAGPIVTYTEVHSQLQKRSITLNKIEGGLKLFTIGMCYKVLFANQLGILWNAIMTIGIESISTPLAWMGMAAYSLQLYYDFYGYSLMAIGLGLMLGFILPTNFTHPYRSRSVTEFWRRWHITLGRWFRDYVYIPLGGSRHGTLCTIRNLLIVWILTGIWHGAGWNFILWGLFLFVFLLVEKLGLKEILDQSNLLSRLYVLLVIPISWMFFALDSLKEIKQYLSRLFPFFSSYSGNRVKPTDFLQYGKLFGPLILICCFFATPYPIKFYKKFQKNPAMIIFLLVIFWYSVYQLTIGVNNPFLYFRF